MSNKFSDWQYWILQNLQLLSKKYGENRVLLDAKTWQCLLIANFGLPPTWRQTTSQLIIILPEKAQVFCASPDRFYLEKGLRTVTGEKPRHYFESAGFNDMSGSNLARFSFHLKKGWYPKMHCKNGTTLLDILEGLCLGLDSAAREAMK